MKKITNTEKLKDLYINSNLSNRRIAEELGINIRTLYQNINKLKLEKRSNRMGFTRRTCASKKFIDLPVLSKVAYFQLGTHASYTKGVIEYLPITSRLGITDKDLEILEKNGFLRTIDQKKVQIIY